jgi:ATP-dependent DNA helicase RecG
MNTDPLPKLVLGTRLGAVLGDATAKALQAAFGITDVEGLLRHYPRRYAERGELTDLAQLVPGEHATVMAEISRVNEIPGRGKAGSRLEVTVTDGTANLDLAFFAHGRWHRSKLKVGARGLFAGKVGEFRGRRQLAHPEYALIPTADDEDVAAEIAETFANALIPVYPATAKLPSWRIARAISIVLSQVELEADSLPEDLRSRYKLISNQEAFIKIHKPSNKADIAAAIERLRFEEAFVLQIALAQRRLAALAVPAISRNQAGNLLNQFDAQLPFKLTPGQLEVAAQLAADLAKAEPMNRLLHGEVGAGKTVVALRAMLQVVESGGQAALLAPTSVLANQHFQSISNLLGELGVGPLLSGNPNATKVTLLTGAMPAAAKRAALAEIASGDAGIVIGTHALLEEQVQFHDLGLVVVDEQHRFGVEQRDRLRERAKAGTRPHLLVMTATPIPRTVAMTVFGDLDVSQLIMLPAGRKEIATHVVASLEQPAHLARVWQRIIEEAKLGHRTFIVCPRIGGDEAEDDITEANSDPEAEVKRPPLAVLDVLAKLQAGPLAELKLAALHGRLADDEKSALMSKFNSTAADAVEVLVCTTVIEVGVDVPIATMMVVLDADRFGIAQLHQLRGRVGRGGLPGLCVLVSEAEADSLARQRLASVAATNDGFVLAEVDLEQRREGNILGATQSGIKSKLRLLEVTKHAEVVEVARVAAFELVATDPTLANHPNLKRAVAAIVGDEGADWLERS